MKKYLLQPQALACAGDSAKADADLEREKDREGFHGR